MDFEGRGGGVWHGDDGGAGGNSGGHRLRLRRPGAGVGFLRVVALLKTCAPEVAVAGCPVVAVRGVLANDDPEAGLAAREGTGDLEALPGCRERDLRGTFRPITRVAGALGPGSRVRAPCKTRSQRTRAMFVAHIL